MQGILLCALYRAMARLGAGPELVVELEGHGRDLVPQACVERTVGWFTRFRLLRLSPWQEAATAHGAMPRMREIPGADTSVPAGRRIRFNYLGQLGMQNKDWFEPLPSVWPGDVGGSNRMACRLCVDLMLTRGCLEVYFTFDAGDTLGARLPDVFLKALEEGTKEPFSADR